MKPVPWYKVILKWIIITLVVLVGLTTILLGLGYLLQENEKETRALKHALEVEQAQ